MTSIPNEHENPEGLHQRYIVMKKRGPTDPRAIYFVLRLDNFGNDPEHIAACRLAADAYATAVERIPKLSKIGRDLRVLVDRLEREGRTTGASAAKDQR